MNKRTMQTKFEFEQECRRFNKCTGFTAEYHPGTKNHATLIINTKHDSYAYDVNGYRGAIAKLIKIGGYRIMKVHVLIEDGNVHTDIVSTDINKVIRALVDYKNSNDIRAKNPKQLEMNIKPTKNGWEVTL